MADDVVGWVSGPTERGTLALVWSCVITIFACTWTVLHLNVPGRDDTSLTVALRKLKWMVINVIFPEFVFSKAVCDLRLALQELRDFDDHLDETRKTIKWNTRHFGDSYIIHWAWEIEYPDGWFGLLYDLLRLDRPPRLLKEPAENVNRKFSLVRGFLRRCIFGPPSVSAHPENTSLELEDRQPMEGLSTEDHRETGAAQRQSDSIHQVSSPQGSQRNSLNYHVQDSVRDPKGHNHGRVDRAISNPEETTNDDHTTTDGGHTSTSSRYTPFQEQDTVSTITQDSHPSTRIVTQQWTVVHSYYAQMGGLVFPDREHGTCITASHLTGRYGWPDNVGHPLMHLVLGKDDIQDKSKADWLLKSLAVLQVTWIVFHVIVRHITGLPISQIEIVTVAFAIMAVLIYLANWWKPKDISRPTTLQYYDIGEKPSRTLRDRKQSFTQRILSPTKAIDAAERGVPDLDLELIRRVANDVIWLEGDIPLLFYLMAGSSFIFGALHCLAWNFEFPTRVELVCWRVASLTSAFLPIVALAVSTILGHLVASKFSQRHIYPKFQAEFDLILPAGPRRFLMWPKFVLCSDEALLAFLRMPKPRNWENLSKGSRTRGKRSEELEDLIELGATVSFIDPSRPNTVIPSWDDQAHRARKCKNLLQRPEVLDHWRDFEAFVKRKYPWIPGVAADEGAETTYLYQILDVIDKISAPAITFKKRADRASNIVSITSFILYTAARLIILVLCFTSLRAAPAGLYQDNVWTRFLPKIS